jgi:HTH-type transcriptional regulator/antitoxin HigA
MKAKTMEASPPESDPYLDLVRRFRLVPIRDDAHLEEALAMIDRLLGMDLDGEAQGYLDVLTDLVEAYEDEHVSMPRASEADVLRLLMQSNKISQSKLSKQLGIAQSTISNVLRGVRSLTKDQVVLLARYFNVGPGVFLTSAPGQASDTPQES